MYKSCHGSAESDRGQRQPPQEMDTVRIRLLKMILQNEEARKSKPK
jgi:hypothetical protein